MERDWEDLDYTTNRYRHCWHANTISMNYVNYDKEYGTKEMSPCFMKMIADHLGFTSKEVRERVYGPMGEVSIGFGVEGLVPIYGVWPTAKKLTTKEKANLQDVASSLQERIAHLDATAKWRKMPYEFEDEQTMSRCYQEVEKLWGKPNGPPLGKGGPHAERILKKDVPPHTWVWPDRVEVSLPEKKALAVGAKVDEIYDLLNKIQGDKYTQETLADVRDALEELNACTSMLKILLKKMALEVEARDPMALWSHSIVKGRVHVMTDASATEDQIALGGILFRPDGSSVGFSIFLTPKEIPLPLRRLTILNYELLAVWMAQILFEKELAHQNAAMHVDNAAACYDLGATYGTKFIYSQKVLMELLEKLAKEAELISTDLLL
eukprot:g334.t1